MKIGEVEKWLKEKLKDYYDDNEAAKITLLLLEDGTGFLQKDILMNKEQKITSKQYDVLTTHVQRLQQYEPIQYIMNKTWFYGMELYVDKAVLVPRPETEELVDWLVKDIKIAGKDVFEKEVTDADLTTGLKILDIGTGSGCIALALKKSLPKAEVWGCDISDEALNVARRNGSALDVRVDFQGIDFLDEAQQKSLPTVDIIVSNPPYIPLSDKNEMHENVVVYEPHTALFVPNNDTLLFYKAIAHFAKKRLYENGFIYLEIHEGLGREVANLFKDEGYENITLKKDMQGKDRMVKIRKAGENKF
jgi:release factor glutamine methyltransferase